MHGVSDFTLREVEAVTTDLVFSGTGINVRSPNFSFLLTRGHDTIYGNRYGDALQSDDGNDLVYGGGGDDAVFGGNHRDTLNGGEGADTLYGENHNDLLRGDAGNDSLSGDAGADRLEGGVGDDSLRGGADNDSLHGNEGNDLLVGADGHDRLAGHTGNDSISDDDGNDVLYAGAGNDSLAGGQGRDVFYVGQDADRDVIILHSIHDSRRSSGVDTVYEFIRGNDVIDLSGIDANTRGSSGDDAFVFSSNGPARNAVWVESYSGGVYLLGDVTGNTRADFRIKIAGVQTLGADDLIL